MASKKKPALPVLKPEEIDRLPTLRDRLAQKLVNAMHAAGKAKREVDACYAALLKDVGTEREGARTVKTTLFKITTTGKLTRTLDEHAAIEARKLLPVHLAELIFPIGISFKVGEYRSLEKVDPELAGRIYAATITEKSAKPGLAVKPVGSDDDEDDANETEDDHPDND